MSKNKLTGVVLIDSSSKNPELKDFRLSDKEVKEYKPEKGGEDMVHYELERVAWRDGDKISLPTVQMVNINEWLFMRKKLIQQGYNYIRILHAPAEADCRLVMNEAQVNRFLKVKRPRVKFDEANVDVIKAEAPKKLTRRDMAEAKADAGE